MTRGEGGVGTIGAVLPMSKPSSFNARSIKHQTESYYVCVCINVYVPRSEPLRPEASTFDDK
jgi:hypothetical protein